MSTRLLVATLNILNLADRWAERLPLLLADFAALQPDLVGLQEVVYVMQQDRILAAAGAREYRSRRGWAGRPEYGNAILVAAELAPWLAAPAADDRVDLGLTRSAHRADLRLEDGTTLRFANTHLHHRVADAPLRDEQARQLLAWLEGLGPAEATILTGDFNAPPHEPTHARLLAAGFRSAYAEANGAEPEVTWPSGLVAPAMDTEGKPACLDYVWLRGAVRAVSARLGFHRPSAEDPTLYPSDHRAVIAELEVGA